MATRKRSTETAKRILREEQITGPGVPVERIARKFASVIHEDLPESISGLLVPVPANVTGKEWVIVVNRHHPMVRRRFTIAHELGHLLLHRYRTPHADLSFPVRFRDAVSSLGSVREEIEANQFAAELLLPERAVLRHLEEIGLEYAAPEADADTARKLTRLARTFKVSVQALTFRIANLAEAVP